MWTKGDDWPERRREMKSIKSLAFVMLFVGILGVGVLPLWVGGVFSGVIQSPESDTCHIRFPAIREETLYRDRPVLKDWGEGDIIDFIGPCGYDPLGREEIQSQRAELYDEASDD